MRLSAAGQPAAALPRLLWWHHASGYQQHSYSLSGFAGQSVTLKFTGAEDISLQTSFVLDDTAVTSS